MALIYLPKTRLLLSCALFFFGQAKAAEESKTFINFAVQYYPPFIIEHAQEQGVLIDIFELFSAQYHYQPHYLVYPEKRSSIAIERGNVDVRMESEHWYRGTMQMCWSEPIYTVEDVFVTHKESGKFDINGLNERLFLGRFGYTYPQLELSFDNNLLQRKDYYSEFDILSVLAGGSDKGLAFSIVGEPTLRWLQLKYPVFKSTISVHGVSDVAPLQLQFGRTQRAKKLCDDFNHFYTDFKKTEQFKQILLKYGL
ncbi:MULTISPECIES: amino acid ABC transporter substrate-binding protein [Pseudoalteromonas]|uniref:amino acid ABC transporter substrate-binding protein n=1 Tax=Pseudoalteromonas TaxID=53246 RepID=UPI000FFEF774|nr:MULTISPECIES: amino acid ABC transporter substrate-binding protein [Pseudoalteromonas]MCG9758444.1 amino acid ABC transporter substrate-binding protein [Pseudoalteromonas sp. Isolate6]NKC21701.1 amino acid ABC transporter substrate-binding protein [Pseudoalteromonas galatheae]RXE88149.1 amino acid ABC transporter substrate-binding protein [Pseudoalteromonas sp. A757]